MTYKVKRFSTREKATPEILKKAEEEGVVQEIDGKWRIVSIKNKSLWPSIYTSREKAESALRGYHASKGK